MQCIAKNYIHLLWSEKLCVSTELRLLSFFLFYPLCSNLSAL